MTASVDGRGRFFGFPIDGCGHFFHDSGVGAVQRGFGLRHGNAGFQTSQQIDSIVVESVGTVPAFGQVGLEGDGEADAGVGADGGSGEIGGAMPATVNVWPLTLMVWFKTPGSAPSLSR
jgi:hypothetical protein